MAGKKTHRAVRTLKDLTPDPNNARLHGDRNVKAITSSLAEVGAARSIVIDEGGVVLAGNATLDAAKRAGLTKLQVVDVSGDTIVAVRRTGLSKAQKVRLALADNRAAELADGWDTDVLKGLAEDGVDLEGLWEGAELEKLLEVRTFSPGTESDQGRLDEVAKTKCPKCGHEFKK